MFDEIIDMMMFSGAGPKVYDSTLTYNLTGANGSTPQPENGPTNFVYGSSSAISTAVYTQGALSGVVYTPTATGFAPGSGDFCIELDAAGNGTNNNYNIMFDTTGSGSAYGGLFIEISSSRGFVVASESAVQASVPSYNPNANNSSHRYTIDRHAGTVRLFVDGALLYSGSWTASITAQGAAIGGYLNDTYPAYRWNGSVLGARFSLISRWQAAYTPTPLPF